MKTLTELNGTLIRKAAAAIAEAKRVLPREAPAVAEAPAPAGEAGPAAEAAQAPAPDAAPAEAAPTEAAPPAAPAPAPTQQKGQPAEAPETEAVKAALDAAVATATGLSGDRLARLRDAVVVVGRQLEDVRLVRVFGPEEPVTGAKTHSGFQYLVDLAPASMRQDWSVKKEKRFGGGGGGKGRGGTGAGGKGAPASGGFSMDSLKDDRKGSRGGPGGGRGRPGGGSSGR